MKKFLKDDTKEAQSIPKEVWEYFQVPPEKIEQGVSERWKVAHFYSDKNYSVQILFNTEKAVANNGYLVFLFNRAKDMVFYFALKSLTPSPQIWDRNNGIDYSDFIKIQKLVNDSLTENQLPQMKYDFSLENRTFYFSKKNVPAADKPALVEFTHKLVGVFPDNKRAVI